LRLAWLVPPPFAAAPGRRLPGPIEMQGPWGGPRNPAP